MKAFGTATWAFLGLLVLPAALPAGAFATLGEAGRTAWAVATLVAAALAAGALRR